jgi:GxxExxY protein
MHTDRTEADAVLERITGCGIRVLTPFVAGILQQVYKNAPEPALIRASLNVGQKKEVTVSCNGVVTGEYDVDPSGGGMIVVEPTAGTVVDSTQAAAFFDYLARTGARLCPLRSFARFRVAIRRSALGLGSRTVYRCVSVCICG